MSSERGSAQKKETGGPAFPSYERIEEFDDAKGREITIYGLADGMTLRDYFAAKALAEAMAHEIALQAPRRSGAELFFRYDAVAHSAYMMADAMLIERVK